MENNETFIHAFRYVRNQLYWNPKQTTQDLHDAAMTNVLDITEEMFFLAYNAAKIME